MVLPKKKDPSLTNRRLSEFKLPTKSSRMLDVLKSQYIIGVSAPCKKARPLAAPTEIFNLVSHVKDSEIPVISNHTKQDQYNLALFNEKLDKKWISVRPS